MRKGVVLVAGCSVLAVLIGLGAGRSYFSSRPVAVDTRATAGQAELSTGTIASRWPGAPEAGDTATAAPSIQPVAATAAPARTDVAATACANPDALGISRTVEIDTTGGPGLGLSQYKDYDFLQPGEVALTFDDGPWPVNTPAVLAALAHQCVKAVFFPIGKHASWHPEILKQVVAQGHTIGSHTWSHLNLAIKPLAEAKAEIEKGISSVVRAAGRPTAPFFRFPQLRQNAELKAYLRERNISAFSIDVDSEDFRIKKPEQLVASTMAKLKKTGKGIILMHDFQHSTALALPELLLQLKAGGYKVVFITAKDPIVTLPEYDVAVAAAAQPARASNTRPISSVIRTVGGATN
ncbi:MULTISPECIES: polysaccharide deacetylase family protein [Rhodopseudomonas]|uniref:Chitooligosaccharide deacetylase n=1 Tax=Rhodopseudomonas palustris TaxID=1076 RepID=A0A0D7EM39_RHOPL|nr:MULTISPECIES: polysaccharide deacetylase family protein [Rhodopseudomonas]KIZ41853.1 polysaccharide deacetylase [Rhodopseudomonas palustris]MDF3811971.1 polysaccharide deacetylase family protein [Rhodopseudomonas sp. BAL398]WOK20004.1 polysaccharide deacetylase family protein [Rhodopseudomonas sp. BAL398]